MSQGAEGAKGGKRPPVLQLGEQKPKVPCAGNVTFLPVLNLAQKGLIEAGKHYYYVTVDLHICIICSAKKLPGVYKTKIKKICLNSK